MWASCPDLEQCAGSTLWLLSCTCATCGAAALQRACAHSMLLLLSRVATNLVRRLCERGKCDTWMRFPAACCCPRFPQRFGAVTELSLAHRGGSCSHEADPDLAGCLHPCFSTLPFQKHPRMPSSWNLHSPTYGRRRGVIPSLWQVHSDTHTGGMELCTWK